MLALALRARDITKSELQVSQHRLHLRIQLRLSQSITNGVALTRGQGSVHEIVGTEADILLDITLER